MRPWLVVIFVFGLATVSSRAQKLEITKPPAFRDRELPAEKSTRKKYTVLRRVYANTVTRYNFLYNCKRLYADVMEKAKDHFRDNYTRLLPLYDYSLDFISTSLRPQLDSILTKTSTAVLTRDLRNQWADDIYLYMGKAYYLRKEFDSAAMIFQFMNEHFRPTKGVGGRITRPLRSTRSHVFGIFEQERNGWFSPSRPARNEALIWLVRTHIEREEYYDAITLLDVLQKSVYLPSRLKPFLNETAAYYYYKRGEYLQSAQYLSQTLSLSRDRQEKARRCFLVAQLYNLSERQDLATKFLRAAIKYTYDPVLEIYCRLNFLLQETHPNVYVINDHIALMAKLLSRERFKNYKDLIYYALSFMAVKKNDLGQALRYINLSKQHIDQNNSPRKAIIYTQIFDLLWQKKQYYLAAKTLDSVHLPDQYLEDRNADLKEKQQYLSEYARLTEQKQLHDSLSKISRYTDAQLHALVKHLAKTQQSNRKRVGYPQRTQYGNPTKTTGKVWYFDNPQAVAEGIRAFRQQWGDIKNADQWGVSSRTTYGIPTTATQLFEDTKDPTNSSAYKDFEANILSTIPRTPQQRRRNDSVLAVDLFQLAEIEALSIKDNGAAQQHLEEILTRFPQFCGREDVFALLYFVRKGQTDSRQKTAAIKKLSQQYAAEFPQGKYAKMFTRQPLNTANNHTAQTPQASKHYEQAYKYYHKGDFATMTTYLNSLDSLDTTTKTYVYKSRLMRAIGAIRTGDKNTATNLLRSIVFELERYPRPADAETKRRAEGLLKTIDKQTK